MSDRSKNKYPPGPFHVAAALESPENRALADEFDSLAAFYTMLGNLLRRAEQLTTEGVSKAVVDVEVLRDLFALARILAIRRLSTLQSEIEDAAARGKWRQRGPRPSMIALQRRYAAELARLSGQQPVRKKPGPRTNFEWTEEKVRALHQEAVAETKRRGKRPTDRSLVIKQMTKELVGTGSVFTNATLTHDASALATRGTDSKSEIVVSSKPALLLFRIPTRLLSE